METLPARDRQDVPILQAIDAKNYKQATRLIDKRLAKKPTDYLEVRIKAHNTSKNAWVFVTYILQCRR